MTAAVTVRPLHPDETRAFLEVHHAAVRGLAAADYPAEVIDRWAPLPIAEADVARVRANPDGERRFAAELDGRIVGIGAVVPDRGELRACYVAPEAARRSVGTAIVRKLEETARADGVVSLWLDASTNAEAFYAGLGYRVVEHGRHELAAGLTMACVKMRKAL